MSEIKRDAEIITLGEIVIPKKKKLSQITWDSFFPYESWYPAIRTTGSFQSAKFYLDFLDKIRDDCKPCHLTVTGIGFDEDVVIESFDYYHQAGDHEDTYYSISFKKYQSHTVSILSSTNTSSQGTTAVGTVLPNASTSQEPKGIVLGCKVILNGTVYRDSYGHGAGRTFTNYRGVVNLINRKGSHPFHVTTPSGQALGWVTKESVVLA